MSHEYLQREAQHRRVPIAVSPQPPVDREQLLHHGWHTPRRQGPGSAAADIVAPWSQDNARTVATDALTGDQLTTRRLVAGFGALESRAPDFGQFGAGPVPGGGGGGGSGSWAGGGDPVRGTPPAPAGHPANRTAIAAAGTVDKSYLANYSARRRFAHAGKNKTRGGEQQQRKQQKGETETKGAVPVWFRPVVADKPGAWAAPQTPGHAEQRVGRTEPAEFTTLVPEPPVVTGLQASIQRAGRARRTIAAELDELLVLGDSLNDSDPTDGRDNRAHEAERAYVAARIAGLENYVASIDWVTQDLRNRGAAIAREDAEQEEETETRRRQRQWRQRQRERELGRSVDDSSAIDMDELDEEEVEGVLRAWGEANIGIGTPPRDGADGDGIGGGVRHRPSHDTRGHRPELESLLKSMLRPRRPGSEASHVGPSGAARANRGGDGWSTFSWPSSESGWRIDCL